MSIRVRLVVCAPFLVALGLVLSGGGRALAAPWFPDSNLPPATGQYLIPGPIMYPAVGVIAKDAVCDAFSPTFPPPGGGASQVNAFNGMLREWVSIDFGATWFPLTASVQYQVRITDAGPVGLANVYNTEMLAMDLSGGTLPPGVLVRESPTLASTGRTLITPDSGGYRIDSFFDVFFELTFDGGQTWIPAQQSSQMFLVPEPSACSLLALAVASLLARRRQR